MKRNDGDQYLLQDGTYADPKDCTKGKDGVLRHENGLAVALRDDGEPQTLGSITKMNEKAAAVAVAGGVAGGDEAPKDEAKADEGDVAKVKVPAVAAKGEDSKL